MGRAPEPIKHQKARTHGPLASQLKEDTVLTGNKVTNSSNGNGKSGKRATKRNHVEQSNAESDAILSARIMKMARDQQREELDEPVMSAVASTSTARPMDQDNDEDDEEEDDYGSEEDEIEDVEYFNDLDIDEADQAALDAFMPNSSDQPVNLADMIMGKIAQHEEIQAKKIAKKDGPPLNDKVVEVYTKVGQLLSRYKSGPLPKAFKILPTMPSWLNILDLTAPENWTPHATYAATKIFASNLDPKQSQKFYKEILLERVREEIADTKKLSVQLYMALKKSMYKPSAFFKGILFPLCESGTCTLREAAIIGSVVSKVSIPVLHSGAALLKLAEMDYTGPNSLFIRVLLDKKYALPFKVVDALVFHFIRFKRDPRELPVLWHQAFLVFAQRYKSDLTPEQKEALIDVMRSKSHPAITPEIRRELVNSVARGEILDQEMAEW